MRVLAHPADKSASRLYRLAEPIRVLNDPNITETYNRKYQLAFQPSPFGDRVVDVLDPPEEDVLIFQRVLSRRMVELIGVLRERYGKVVVVEIDDDFHALPLRHPIRADVDPSVSHEKNRDWLMRACEQADLVTVTTPALASRYGAHGRVAVLPNFVPAHYLEIRKKRHDGIWVGWAGSTHSHVGDLAVTKGAVGRAIQDAGAQLRVVGPPNGVAKDLRSIEPIATGPVGLDEYPKRYAQLDIAIAPLRPSTFNAGKSGLKAVEAASLGVPIVMSPSPEYLRLHQDYGIGLIAETPDDWYRHVSDLITNTSLRVEIADRGELAVREFLTSEQNAHLWYQAWRDAFVNRNSAMVSA